MHNKMTMWMRDNWIALLVGLGLSSIVATAYKYFYSAIISVPSPVLAHICLCLFIIIAVALPLLVRYIRNFHILHGLHYPNDNYPSYQAECEFSKGFNEEINK